MSTNESRHGPGPAGDAFLALVHAFEPLLIIAEEMLGDRRTEIERLCARRRDEANTPAQSGRGGSEERWNFETEYRARLEREMLYPIREAISLGNAAYERLEAHGPEVVDGAARLLVVIRIHGLDRHILAPNETKPLEMALRKLTEQPESVLKAEVEAETCPNCGEPKVMDGPPCFGDDVCCEGPDGGPAQPCAGWGRYCCRCGRDYALGQLP
jgi:hypothetical protein